MDIVANTSWGEARRDKAEVEWCVLGGVLQAVVCCWLLWELQM